jgi:hypothetical protein
LGSVLEFCDEIYSSLDQKDSAIIADEAKGLIESTSKVPPQAVYFHCLFHQRQNIAKVVKGGNVKKSCLWLFNKLAKAHTKQKIEHIKHTQFWHVNNKALKYLNTLEDKGQYPGARCKIGGNYIQFFIYQHSASLAVESIKRASNSACARTAVYLYN